MNSASALPSPTNITRRHALRRAAGLAALGAATLSGAGCACTAGTAGRVAVKGRIKHSIVPWCYQTAGDKWSMDQVCQVAKRLGCLSVELVLAEDLPILKKHGLTCAIMQINMNPDPPFLKGFNNPDHWPRVIKATEDAINASADFGCPSVICFTGYSAKNPGDPSSPHISLEDGAKNCVEGLKKIAGLAEKKNINVCMEMLNTREDSHPMKGHPGYQGNHVDYCIDILKRVGSPRMKLLFDVYHVQIQDGDIIRRLHQNKDYIGHVHVAGNPGRGELDNKQEINFPPIMEALLDIKYTGYVGQEFIPTRDATTGLREAITLCDV